MATRREQTDLEQETSRSRTRHAYESTWGRGTAVYERGRLWIENQDPASRKGATIGWVRRYQAADGQLYAVLLSAYCFLTIVPLLLVLATYVYDDPQALAKRIEHRLGLEGSTSRLFDTVMAGASGHKLSVALIAVVDLFFFGLGFGRVLQLAHARSWGLDLRKSVVMDQVRYLEVLGAVAAMLLLFVLQTKALRGQPAWIGWVLDVGWFFLLVAFFVWAPWLLLHGRIGVRAILPGAVFTIVGLVGMRLISGVLLKHWLEWYSKTYGAFGIVMAIVFWLIVFGTIMILAAALSPALAHRRDLLRASLAAR
jgi:membrane protein